MINQEPLFEGCTERGSASPSADKSVATDLSDAPREKTVLGNHFINELKLLYPQFIFKSSKIFKFRPPKTIYIAYGDDNFALLTLHELGHALSKHKDYKTCVDRLKIEREAWERARAVLKNHPEWAKKYHIIYDEDFVEAQLDTYRDWLHQKSTCKKCGLTRFQTPDGLFHCPRCNLLLKAP